MGGEIEVLKIHPYTRGGALKAFIDIRLGGVTINDCRIIHADGKEPFVAMPQKEVPQPDGTKGYYPIVKLNDNLEKKVREAVLLRWNNQGHV